METYGPDDNDISIPAGTAYRVVVRGWPIRRAAPYAGDTTVRRAVARAVAVYCQRGRQSDSAPMGADIVLAAIEGDWSVTVE